MCCSSIEINVYLKRQHSKLDSSLEFAVDKSVRPPNCKFPGDPPSSHFGKKPVCSCCGFVLFCLLSLFTRLQFVFWCRIKTNKRALGRQTHKTALVAALHKRTDRQVSLLITLATQTTHTTQTQIIFLLHDHGHAKKDTQNCHTRRQRVSQLYIRYDEADPLTGPREEKKVVNGSCMYALRLLNVIAPGCAIAGWYRPQRPTFIRCGSALPRLQCCCTCLNR